MRFLFVCLLYNILVAWFIIRLVVTVLLSLLFNDGKKRCKTVLINAKHQSYNANFSTDKNVCQSQQLCCIGGQR